MVHEKYRNRNIRKIFHIRFPTTPLHILYAACERVAISVGEENECV